MQYKIIEYTSQDLNLHFRYITKFEKRLRDFENKSQDLWNINHRIFDKI